MADEQAQEEVETSKEETKQPSEETEPVSEDAKTPEEPDTQQDKGDLRVALREEREKRQTLEENLKDPNFVYERAKEVGLTAEEQEELAQTEAPQTPPVPMDANAMNEFYNYKKEVEKFPEAESNKMVAARIATLVNSSIQPDGSYKITPIQALNIAKKEFEEVKSVHLKAGEEAKQQEIAEVNQMRTADEDVRESTEEEEELSELRKKAKSYDRVEQEDAMTEIIKKKLNK